MLRFSTCMANASVIKRADDICIALRTDVYIVLTSFNTYAAIKTIGIPVYMKFPDFITIPGGHCLYFPLYVSRVLLMYCFG